MTDAQKEQIQKDLSTMEAYDLRKLALDLFITTSNMNDQVTKIRADRDNSMTAARQALELEREMAQDFVRILGKALQMIENGSTEQAETYLKMRLAESKEALAIPGALHEHAVTEARADNDFTFSIMIRKGDILIDVVEDVDDFLLCARRGDTHLKDGSWSAFWRFGNPNAADLSLVRFQGDYATLLSERGGRTQVNARAGDQNRILPSRVEYELMERGGDDEDEEDEEEDEEEGETRVLKSESSMMGAK